jgi:hypothetical protein
VTMMQKHVFLEGIPPQLVTQIKKPPINGATSSDLVERRSPHEPTLKSTPLHCLHHRLPMVNVNGSPLFGNVIKSTV